MGRRARRHGPYGVGDEEEGDGRVTIRTAALRRQLERLERDPRVRAAALIAHSFALDPVAIAEERDVLKRLLRVASHNVLQDEQERARKRAKGS